MLCENCGKNQANVSYTQIINGHKKEMHLCEECSQKLGIGNMDFSMPIDFSSFFGDFLEEFEKDTLMPELNPIKQLQCNNCGLTFEDFINTGKFGCSNCYDAFESKIDPILKNIQGSNRHIGRLGTIKKGKELTKEAEEEKKDSQEKSELDILKQDLKQAIKEERYEDAAQIRDKIKKIEN